MARVATLPARQVPGSAEGRRAARGSPHGLGNHMPDNTAPKEVAGEATKKHSSYFDTWVDGDERQI